MDRLFRKTPYATTNVEVCNPMGDVTTNANTVTAEQGVIKYFPNKISVAFLRLPVHLNITANSVRTEVTPCLVL